MTPWLLPLSIGSSLCCTEVLPLPLLTSTQRPTIYFRVAWRRLQWHMVQLAGLGPWSSGLDILPHLFSASETCHALPRPWEDSIPDLRGTQLRTA